MKIGNNHIRVVVAIDFGTSRSGYAYAFNQEQEPIVRTNWSNVVQYPKTATYLLYSPDQTVEAWGWDALSSYAYQIQGMDGSDRHFFQNFKMHLYQQEERTKDSLFITNNGKKFLVLKLIADYLKCLKETALAEIKESVAGLIEDTEILWCLTVPAIWTNADKQLMRRAAQEASLIGTGRTESERLVLVLEPEAAAIYCQKKEIDKSDLTPGSRLMVVDCGGGTVDITVHEVLEQDRFREVVEGTGGDCGSTYVDRDFQENYLAKKLGSEVIKNYEKEYPCDFLNMMFEWERIKCSFNPQTSNPVIFLTIQSSLHIFLNRPDNNRNGKRYADYLKRLAQEQNGDDTKIHIDQKGMVDIFDKTLNKLVDKVEEQFQKLDSRGCDFIYLVGGFSHSPLLQQRIKEKFGQRVNKKIVIPRGEAPGGAIVKGAVWFGWNPPVNERCSRFTYGCLIHSPFEVGIDPEDKKYESEDYNAWYCKNRFDIFVKAGDAIQLDQKVQKTYSAAKKDQTSMHVAFYATKEKKIRYTDELGAKLIGEIVVQMPDISAGLKRTVEVSMYFGRTEILVEARDQTSGKEYNTTLSFFSTDFQESDEEPAIIPPKTIEQKTTTVETSTPKPESLVAQLLKNIHIRVENVMKIFP